MTGALVKVGASLTLMTVTVKDTSSVRPVLSVARTVTALAPTWLLFGVQLMTPAAEMLMPAGEVTRLWVSVAPGSGSLAATVRV